MNVARFVVEYGSIASGALLAGCALVVLVTLRRGGRPWPRGAGAWIVCLLALAVGVLSATFFGFVSRKTAPLRPVFAQAHRAVPDLGFTEVGSDARHTLAEYRGKVVVLNLWATWCPPCRREMPALDRLQRDYGARGVVVIALSDEADGTLRRFPGFDSLHVVRGRVDPAVSAPGLYVSPHVARPVTHVIDREGVLRETLVGGADFATFESKVRECL